MSTRTSQSSIFGNEEPQQNGGAGVKRVWNRRTQQWMEVVVTEEEAAAQAAAAAVAVSEQSGSVSSNSFASGTNQNAGNVLTERSSTRVHAPPGGKSSFSIGGYPQDDTPKARVMPPPRADSAQGTFPDEVAAPVAAVGTQMLQQQQQKQEQGQGQSYGGGSVSSNVFANGANQNSGNFITDRSSTRIHNPPGGASTFTLG